MNMHVQILVASLLTGLACALGNSLERRSVADSDGKTFDYVILGGGTAGLVVASRLSENPLVTVAVVEAGDFEENNPNVTDPTGLGLAKNTRVDWQYASNPAIFADNQSRIYSAGKGVGGSSLINGMTYMRPASSQIDLWPSLGLDLDWTKLFNYSKKGEHFQIPTPNLVELGASYEPGDHGYSGPVLTCISPHMTNNSLHDTLNATFKAVGIPPRLEFNGGNLRGFGVQMAAQNVAANVREDAGRAYYYPYQNRQNLLMFVNTTATRIVWSQDTPQGLAVASAAEVVGQDGEPYLIHANREIILSAGAFRSPAILEHSGVGNPRILSKYSINTTVDLPSVGENLQDQTTMAITATSIGYNSTGFPVFVSHTSFQDLFGTGSDAVYNSTLAKLPAYAAAIADRSDGALNATEQEYLLKTQLELLVNSNTPASEVVPLSIQTLIGAVFWPLQPFSRGSVHINSTDRTTQPNIDSRFFEFDFDGQMAVATAKFTRKVLLTPPLSDFVNITSLNPSLETIPEDASDEQWLDWVKTKSSFQPNYHDLGTCAMLPKAMGGVVDNDFRVYGTRNVRVVDLSVIPLQVAGHSTALLYGVAEWASTKIGSCDW